MRIQPTPPSRLTRREHLLRRLRECCSALFAMTFLGVVGCGTSTPKQVTDTGTLAETGSYDGGTNAGLDLEDLDTTPAIGRDSPDQEMPPASFDADAQPGSFDEDTPSNELDPESDSVPPVVVEGENAPCLSYSDWTVLSTFRFQQYGAMVPTLDRDENVHALYRQYQDGPLWYGYELSDTWVAEPIELPVGRITPISLNITDDGDVLALVLSDGIGSSDDHLILLTQAGDEWRTATIVKRSFIDDGVTAELDENGALHIVYATASTDDPRHFRHTSNRGGSWSEERIGTFDGFRIRPALEFKGRRVHVAYHQDRGYLIHGYLDGVTWQLEEVIEVGQATEGSDVGLAFDAAGNAHFLWQNYEGYGWGSELFYGAFEPDGFDHLEIDAVDDYFTHPDDDDPYIGYFSGLDLVIDACRRAHGYYTRCGEYCSHYYATPTADGNWAKSILPGSSRFPGTQALFQRGSAFHLVSRSAGQLYHVVGEGCACRLE